MEQLEMTPEEKKALNEALAYLERKAGKSAYWAERIKPLEGLIARLKGTKP